MASKPSETQLSPSTSSRTLPELIAADLASYEALALKLATDPAALAEVKAKLAQARGTAPLFDTTRFTRNLEAAYVALLAGA